MPITQPLSTQLEIYLRMERDSLLRSIAAWRRHNSQSDPSAAADMREMRKRLAEIDAALRR
jgi:hypothetical protein